MQDPPAIQRRSMLKAASRQRMRERDKNLFCPVCGGRSRGLLPTKRAWVLEHIRTTHARTAWLAWAKEFRQKEAHYFSVPPPAGAVYVLPRADWPIPEGWEQLSYVVMQSTSVSL